MWTSRRLRLCVCLVTASFFSLAMPVMAFTFKSPNIDIKLLFQAMAKEAKVNILLDKSVRGTVPVDLEDVDPVKAMQLVAGLNKLVARKVDAGGSRDTYMIGDPRTVEEGIARTAGKEGAAPAMTHEQSGPYSKSEWPTSAIHASVCGIHFYNGESQRQVIAHHYCSHLSDEVLQCVVYDSPKKDARLIGVEYIVSERVFNSLSEDEKKLWHSHAYEIKSGALMSLGMTPDKEKELMKGLMRTYGKTWHFWQVDKGDTLPLGIPQLMMGFTADGQASPKIVDQRDKDFGVSTAETKKAREDIPDVPIASGANAWMTGDIEQLELRKLK